MPGVSPSATSERQLAEEQAYQRADKWVQEPVKKEGLEPDERERDKKQVAAVEQKETSEDGKDLPTNQNEERELEMEEQNTAEIGETERQRDKEELDSRLGLETENGATFSRPSHTPQVVFFRLLHFVYHLVFTCVLLLSLWSIIWGTCSLFVTAAEEVYFYFRQGVTHACAMDLLIGGVGMAVFLVIVALTVIGLQVLVPVLWRSFLEVIISPWTILFDSVLP